MAGLLLAALLLPARAAAASHDLLVRVWDGKTTYSRTLKVSAGQQANANEPVEGRDGSKRRLIVNAYLAAGKEGTKLSYQLELGGTGASKPPGLQAQGEAAIRPGSLLRAVECAGWTVDIGLDAPKDASKSPSFAALGNHRSGVELGSSKGKVKCRQVLHAGSQGNVVEHSQSGGRKYGLILNQFFSVAADRRSADLQFQLEYNPRDGGKPLQLQDQRSLTVGRQDSVDAQGYRLGFLIEGPASKAAPAVSVPKGPARPRVPEGKGAEGEGIPLLR